MKIAYLIDRDSIGGGMEYIRRQIAAHPNDGCRVFFADRYLKCAEVVVSPSRWEGMPSLMMKARALGCRILATGCPGNRDVLAGYEKWEKLEL